MKEMLSEFLIAQNLYHPNVIEYKYFMRYYDEMTQNMEFHIIVEFMQGDDMDVYLKE